MLDRLRTFVEEHDLFHAQHRLLLAVSAGADSVVLAHLLHAFPAKLALAHVNFQLRGQASDADAAFVERLGQQLDCPVYQTACQVESLAEAGGQSVQMAARAFRYRWFEALRQREGYDLIVLAHHMQDSVETALHHFARGTGIRGLHGIPLRNGRVVRPLLFAVKDEVLAYAAEHGIEFREDSSNRSLSYTRNRIRHELIPAFQSINPKFLQAAAGNIRRMQEAEYLFDHALAHLRSTCVTEDGDRLLIELESLLQHYQAAGTLLYEWLHPLGFGAGQVRQMLDSTGRQPGGRFFSPTHQLLIDRDHLIVEPLPPQNQLGPYYLHQEAEAVHLPDGSLQLQWKSGRPDFFSPDPHRACLDISPNLFPLRIRHWQEGDVFCPLGMHGKHQKLQDFFINQKIPRTEKRKIWIVETAADQICWIVGYRIDQRFRISEATDGYLQIQFRPRHSQPLTAGR